MKIDNISSIGGPDAYGGGPVRLPLYRPAAPPGGDETSLSVYLKHSQHSTPASPELLGATLFAFPSKRGGQEAYEENRSHS